MDKRFFIDKTTYKLFGKFNLFTKEELFEEIYQEEVAPSLSEIVVKKEYFEREFNITKKNNDDEKK